MTTSYERLLDKGRGRLKKLLSASAAALIMSAGLAATAWALPTGPGIRDGKNIGVFHNLDFVAAFGYEVGENLTIDVYRGPHKIATAFGPAIEVDEGLPLNGALEVNHGPEGAAVQGDCWENFTPDVLPGDRIVVTDSAGGTDEVLVDNITMTAPQDDLTTEDPTDVIVEGTAAYADGTPIPVEELNSGEIRVGSRFRASPNEVVRTPGTTDGYRAIYREPYNIERNRDNVDPKQAILDGDHAMGYGHVAPLPSETQMVEGLDGGGPALGCESAPKQANAVTISDDPAINLTSGSLNLSGTAMEMVESVSVTLSDEDPNTADVTVEATELTAGPGEKAWSAEFTRQQVESLTDGKLTAAGTYTLADGPTTGANKTIQKDTVAPTVRASKPARSYNVAQSVNLLASEENSKLFYTTDGSEPTQESTLYNRPIRVAKSQTIKAIAVDGTGNQGAVGSFDYVIRKASRVVLNTPAKMKVGQSRAIRGKVLPAHAGERVKIIVKRPGQKNIVRNLKLNRASAYNLKFKANKVGRYKVTVRFVQDADHKGSAATKSFRVVRR